MPPKKPPDHKQAETLAFDLDSLTLGDLEDFEEMCGKPLMEALKAADDGTLSLGMKEMLAITTIVKRKENPDYTIADARKVKVGEVEILFGDSRPPTQAAS